MSKSSIRKPPVPTLSGNWKNPSSKPKIVLYSQEHANCTCYENIFNHQFETVITGSEDEFLERLRTSPADAAVVCFCTAKEKNAEEFLKLESLAGPLPSLSCSVEISAGFVSHMAQRGFERFLSCRMPPEKIRAVIYEAISHGGLLEYIENYYPIKYVKTQKRLSHHLNKTIQEIVHTFPSRIHESEMAQRLGISRNYIQKMCKQAFGITYIKLLRRIYMRQALHLMRRTPLDNTEIALQLNYSETGNMARDFRKELGCSPTEARKLLSDHSPEELLHP